ncbi:phosphotransferase enzyme family protein [Cohnella kolymensis]|uniref:phosphotransferase enzyme family protein n=1 Tax=Cohnella kolymensis TaxID=1590652 RepID=UPI00069786A0|nr:phosphotransferase [Cohnella kolymensis]
MSQNDYSIAHHALDHYQMSDCRIEFLGQSDNVTFRVVPKSSSGSFLLKILNPSYSLTMIESELLWLEAISKDTELVTPLPMRNKTGHLVTKLVTADEHKSVYVTMQYWVEGEVLDRQPEPAEILSLGSLMSTLHTHAQSWTVPAGFNRPLYGTDHMHTSCKQIKLLVDNGIIDSATYEVILQTEAVIDREFTRLPATKESWGLIHSDLHESNYVFHNGQARPIDFSACGFGYFLFDVAETLLHLTPDRRQLFVEAYGKYHALPDNYERQIEAFFLWAVFRGYAFHSVNPDEYEYLSESVPAIANRFCKKYLCGEPFLLRG